MAKNPLILVSKFNLSRSIGIFRRKERKFRSDKFFSENDLEILKMAFFSISSICIQVKPKFGLIMQFHYFFTTLWP